MPFNTPTKSLTLLDPIEQHVIDKVIKLRKDSKMRQQDIASILHTTTSFVGNVENNRNQAKYNLKHINVLADYFGLSPKYFLPDVPNKKIVKHKGSRA
jgi:transcriptional regulator with XRE-family HTH domain